MQQQQQQHTSHSTRASTGAGGPPVSGGAGDGGALLPSSNLGPVSDGYQLLRMEAATQNETRRLLGCMDVAVYLSLAALLVYLVLRWQPIDSSGTYFMCTTNFSVANLVFACVLFPAAAATAGMTAFRCLRSVAAKKRWTQRRRRLFGLYASQLASATLGLACYLVSNALVVSPAACADAATRRAIYWLAFVRWSCWNTTFLLTTIKAHATTIVPRKAAAAAAKKSWRRLLFLAWEPPFDLFGQQQLHEMEQQAEQQHHDQQQQQQQQHGSLPPDSTTAADIETGLSPAQTSPQQHSNSSVGAHQESDLPDTQRPAKQPGKQQQRQQKPQRPDMLVLDLPWYYHWPKAVIWLLFEGCHIALAVGESLANNERQCRVLTDTCDLHSCWPADWLIAILSTEVALALLYYAVWVWLIVRSSRLLHTRPWQAFKVANLVLRLERRLGVWAYTLIVVTSCVFWFSGLADCSRAAYQYQGLPVTELMWATISILGLLFMQPTDPSKANPRTVVQLQQFSWTEGALEDCIKERNAATKGKLAAVISQQPMFCFETAVKLFFFSSFVYSDYNGAREAGGPGGAVGVPEVELEQLLKGMALYGLNVHKVIFDDDKALKVLFAWNSNCVVVCFRGSTTAANWVANAKLWRSAHPAGSAWHNKQGQWFGSPKIHTGFLRCWSGTGLDRRVLGMLQNLVDTSLDPSKLKIYFTGHSLGGAIATLAAYDLLQKCPKLDRLRQVSVYTFGAPRAGNHSFARVYERVVPDTWHVINDQDTVPRGGKFLSAYKRNGQRAIVNKIGDIVVRPTPLEASMLQAAWGSNPLNHLLQSYQAALTAVALGQLDQLKALPGGAEGLLELIKDCPIVAESMYRYGNQQNLILWIGGRVWYTLNSRAPLEVLRTLKLFSDHALMTNGEGSTMPAAGQAAAAAAAKQRWLELQQTRKQQPRERQLRRQQQRQLRRQGALAASTALDAFDLELGEGRGLRPWPPSAAATSGPDAAMADSAGGGASAAAARVLAGGSRRDWTAWQGAGVSQPWGALGRAAWWLTGGLIGTGPRQTLARELWAEPLADQDRAEGSAALAQGTAAASASLAGAAEAGTSSNSSSRNAGSRPSAVCKAAGAAGTSAAGQGVDAQLSSSGGGAMGSPSCRTDGDTVLTILPGAMTVSGVPAAPPPAPPPATGTPPRHQPSCSSTSSSGGSDCFLGHVDPLEAAAAAQLHAVREQAAKDRLAPALPNPVSQVMGYLTGVMPAWPGLGGEGAEHQGQHGAAPAAAAVGMGQQAHRQQLVQQQQQRPHHDQQQLKEQQRVVVPVGSLLCLSSSGNSSSSRGSSGGKESARFWDAQESGNFSCSSSGRLYYDAASADDEDVGEGPSVVTAGQPVSTPSSAAAASTPFAAASAAQGSRAALPAALPSAAAVPPGTPSSTTSISTTPPASPFAAAAAVGPAQPTTFAGIEAAGNAAPPFTAFSATSLADDAAAAAAAAPSTGRLATAASLGQQGTQYDNVLASSSTAAALDAIQGVDPVGSLGPGSATAMLLNPARTAPQALFNPAAALVGVRKAADKDGEGTLSGLINKVIGSGGSSSSSSGRSSPSAAGPTSRPGTPAAREQQGLSRGSAGDTVRGVLGTLGLQSGGHAAAGTVADTKSAGGSSSSDGGSSHHSRAGDRIKALLPGHHRSSSGGSDSSSSGGGGSGSEDIAHTRYLYSLDVRRLSLASPLLPRSEVAALHTQLHLPVLPEGDGEDGA